MRAFAVLLLGAIALGSPLSANDAVNQAFELESRGNAMEARLILQRASQPSTADLETLTAYAEFLDRYRDPGARAAYEKLLAALERPEDQRKRAAVVRRLVLLSLTDGDRAAASRYLEEYRAAGGNDLASKTGLGVRDPELAPAHVIQIPGPFATFARMAAISQDVSPDEILGALARNVITNGYQASGGNEALEQTEYLKLVVRYLSQARELEKLAGAGKTIRVETCDSTQTGELLRILGYRMRGGCGSEVVLETVNASRAFLTIDSGFPLAELEQDLRTNRPFTYDFKPTETPILYGEDYWMGGKEKREGEFIDLYLADPSLCRLYLGLSKLEPETADALRKTVPMQRLKAFSHVLDFYGSLFEIQNGKAVVPGGSHSARAWADLAGVSPDKGTEFFERLLSRDDGWMASYFDALARIHGPALDYLTQPERMKRFYEAIRGRVTSPGPARPVFRANTDMLLLTTRLRLEPDGTPHIPGGLEVWKNLFINPPRGKYDKALTRAAPGWKDADDVLEALFALCRKAVDNEPLKIFMAMSDLNRGRTVPLEAATVDRLVREFHAAGSQYKVFSEAPSLSDKTIIQFLDTIENIERIRDTARRADTAGSMQALVGLWQIFCRQGSIPASRADESLAKILSKFDRFRESEELFEADRAGIQVLLQATGSNGDASPQERFFDLLAGDAHQADTQAHTQVVQDMMRIFEAQRLISLNTLFELADNLDGLARGEKLNTALVNRMADIIAEIQLPRDSLTSVEKNALSFGYWMEKHIQAERKLNLRAMIDRAGADPAKLKDVRGQLAPFLRDTLVGFNYIHYAPPAAQILYTNPLFVRSHDFVGFQGTKQTWRSTDVLGTGWPSSAGGRLVGSLSGLPYALAEAEQNFLIPSREQALIWGDLVPQMVLSAKIPRWWNVSPAQIHWVGLHMRYAESLLAEAAVSPSRRTKVMELLGRQATPARVHRVAQLLDQALVPQALDLVLPSELFLIARDTLAEEPGASGPLAGEIRRLAAASPERINYQEISRIFGTPKPTLTNSYQPQLLFLRTFPTVMGYSSRIMAESWESNTLYWAALADQIHLPPSQLNVLIPEWTQETVERIFATHLEDWPALLRSLRLIGDGVRAKTRGQMTNEQKASLQ